MGEEVLTKRTMNRWRVGQAYLYVKSVKKLSVLETTNRVLPDKLLAVAKFFCFELSPAYKGGLFIKKGVATFFSFNVFL